MTFHIDPRMLAVALASGFVALAVTVVVRGSVPGDAALLEAITGAAGTRFDGASRLVGDLADPAPLLIASSALIVVLLATRRRRAAGLLAACVGVALVVNPWLKDLVDRPRPEVRMIPEPVSPLAFPAGHAANTAAVAGGLLLAAPRPLVGRVAVAGGALVLVVASSRLVVGAHHPSDLVAGWLWVAAVVAVLWPHRSRA